MTWTASPAEQTPWWLVAPLDGGSLLLGLLLHHCRQIEAEGLRSKIHRYLLVVAAAPHAPIYELAVHNSRPLTPGI